MADSKGTGDIISSGADHRLFDSAADRLTVPGSRQRGYRIES